jgi:tripartite-type tricarboxylate transporter receptor subunit TctC
MKKLKLLSAVLLGLAAGSPALAEFPEKPINIIVTFAPGGPSDNIARIIAPKLTESLGQPVTVENRPGANGALGATQLVQSKPDGHTLMVASIGVFAINPVLYKDLKYNPQKDFDLLSVAVRNPNVLVASPNFPANSLPELIEHLKKNPGKMTFATAGTGSSDHLTTELFWQKTSTSGVHIPYKGGAPAVADIIGGHADVGFANLGTVANHLKAGKLKALAVTSEKRVPELPNAPTLTESGINGVEVYSWQAVAAPKGLPAEVKEKLEKAVRGAINSPDVKQRFNQMGFEVVGNSSKEFEEFLAKETARWKDVVETAKITPDQ